ncbi:MAG TPA: potassium-transporting ATPase subunit C [Acidobacteriaceae bacterium]|nr:potassium-transporting ATPase subunit C [Acidobacteriaceae bacterium]
MDPDITPAAAYDPAPRIAPERKMTSEAVRELVTAELTPRQFGLLGRKDAKDTQTRLMSEFFDSTLDFLGSGWS